VILGIIDLGINNLSSVVNAFSSHLELSDSLHVISGPEHTLVPDLIVLPGLGKFNAGMTELRSRDLITSINSWNENGSKFVGICLGMQLLGTTSMESEGIPGLNLVPGRIARLEKSTDNRVPHTGWARALKIHSSNLFSSLEQEGDFYFTHSYHFIPEREADALTLTEFGESRFVSAILSKNILGLQFHPEKSGMKGRKLISNIIQWARSED